MAGSRYVPKQLKKTGDIWGIWDNHINDWCLAVPGGGPRWQSSRAGALICSSRWNDAGHQI